jgi:hypothetical protein
MSDRLPTLGLDIGGVLVQRAYHDTDTSFFGESPMATPAVEGAVEAVAGLAPRFEYRVHLISKAGPRIEHISRQWLQHTRFFEQTGVSPSNLAFVRRRADKAEVCGRLGVTHVVDDQLSVLQHLGTVPYRYLFVGGLVDLDDLPDAVPEWGTLTWSWPDLAEAIVADLGRP